VPAPDDDDLCGIKAEAFQPGTVGVARLIEGVGFAHKQERTRVAFGETSKKGNRKAGGSDRIASGFTADLMQGIAAKPAAKDCVERTNVEGQERATGRQTDRLPFDFRDPPAEPGKDVPCHGCVCVHGHLNRSEICSCFVLMIPEPGKRVKHHKFHPVSPKNQSCYRHPANHIDGPRRSPS